MAASDAHSITTVGRAYTEVEISGEGSKEDIGYEDVIETIKDGDTAIYGHRVPIYKSAAHYVKAVARKISYFVRTLNTKIPFIKT